MRNSRTLSFSNLSQNTVGRGSAVIFDADSGLCLSYVWTLGPKRNLDHKSFFSLDRYVDEFIQINPFQSDERSSFKFRCQTVIIGIVLCCCHQACCLFTFERLHVFRRGCGFGFKQKFWRIDRFGEKKARIGGFAYPYSPPSLCDLQKVMLTSERFIYKCKYFPNATIF